MYQNLAILCAFIFVYSVLSKGLERTPINGAVVFAAFGLAMKSAVGCSIFVCGAALGWIGFVPNAAQSESALRGLRGLISVFPLACHVGAVLLMLRIDLDEAGYTAIRARMAGRAPGAAMARPGARIAPRSALRREHPVSQ